MTAATHIVITPEAQISAASPPIDRSVGAQAGLLAATLLAAAAGLKSS
jgi:hypothetical protein